MTQVIVRHARAHAAPVASRGRHPFAAQACRPGATGGAVVVDAVMQLLWSIEGDGLAAARDRAILVVGMAHAARRSELVALDVEDLEWEPRGARVMIRRSKPTRSSYRRRSRV